MAVEAGDDHFGRLREGVGDAQERAHGNRLSGFNALPMSNGEAMREHVFLPPAAVFAHRLQALTEAGEERRVRFGRFVGFRGHLTTIEHMKRPKTPRLKGRG